MYYNFWDWADANTGWVAVIVLGGVLGISTFMAFLTEYLSEKHNAMDRADRIHGCPDQWRHYVRKYGRR